MKTGVGKTIFVVTLLFLFSFTYPIAAFAQSNFRQGETVTLEKDEVVEDNYFAAGESVIVSGTVNGDAYLAGGSIIVDGNINGDVLAAGGTIAIRGNVTGNVRAVGGQITVADGEVGRNITVAGGQITVADGVAIGGGLTTAGGNVEVNSPLGAGLQAAAGSLTIGNAVSGNLTYAGEKLMLANGADIAGDVVYYSENDLTLGSQATVAGNLKKNALPSRVKEAGESGRKAVPQLINFWTIVSFVSALIIGFIFTRLIPNFMKSVGEKMQSQLLKSLGVGFLVVFLVPILFIVLLVTVVGLPLAFVLLGIYILVLYFAKIFTAVFVGQLAVNKFLPGKSLFAAYALGLVIFYLIGLIPLVGWLIQCVLNMAAVGALFMMKKEYYRTLSKKNLL